MITHILDESKSPAEALIWTMVCGTQCVAEDDGTLTPLLDFVSADEPHLCDCSECLKRLLEQRTNKTRTKVSEHG